MPNNLEGNKLPRVTPPLNSKIPSIPSIATKQNVNPKFDSQVVLTFVQTPVTRQTTEVVKPPNRTQEIGD